MWKWFENFKLLEVVDEDLTNQVASGPRKLQRYVVETTEVKQNLAKWKKTLFARKLRSSWGYFHKSITHIALNQKQKSGVCIPAHMNRIR
jgi:hypothetical protein